MSGDLKDSRSIAQMKPEYAESPFQDIFTRIDIQSRLLEKRYDELKQHWTQLQPDYDTCIFIRV